ncbi:MAG: hypothetical protein KDC33_12085 [Thermoleophilia bacterium]|nr:hypothetical protein [Thermoleophilia bacterium]
MRRGRGAALVAALVMAVLALTGCAATLHTDIEMDRTGRGTVTLTLTMDREALQWWGLSADDPGGVATRFLPIVSDGGWEPAEGGESVQQNVFAFSSDGDGGVTLATRKRFDNVKGLDDIIGRPRGLKDIAGAQAVAIYGGLPDLPSTAPLINDFNFRLGTGTGDNPGFYFFGRGGVGNIGQQTCAGNRVQGFGRSLRDALQLHYRLRVPGGPGSTNADETSGGASIWTKRYADCPDLQAESGGGSSSTLYNGLILGALASLLVLIFIVRRVRRGRDRKTQVPVRPADDKGSRG